MCSKSKNAFRSDCMEWRKSNPRPGMATRNKARPELCKINVLGKEVWKKCPTPEELKAREDRRQVKLSCLRHLECMDKCGGWIRGSLHYKASCTIGDVLEYGDTPGLPPHCVTPDQKWLVSRDGRHVLITQTGDEMTDGKWNSPPGGRSGTGTPNDAVAIQEEIKANCDTYRDKAKRGIGGSQYERNKIRDGVMGTFGF